jgi:hypothetical protein
MKKIIIISLFSLNIFYAQVPPLEEHSWKLEKIVTADSTLVVPDDITFNGMFQNPNFYNFGNCVFVDGNLLYNDDDQEFLITFSSVPFEVCPDEEELMDIEEFFQNEFFFDVFMVSWHEPFSYEFTTTPDKIFLDIINNEGSVATFYDTFLSQDEFLKQNLKVYPNPIKDKLFIETNNIQIKQIVIYDLSGRIVYQTNDFSGQISLNQLNTGTYIIQLETSAGGLKSKLLKQ